MTPIHYYLSVFPMEALIASQLAPEDFGKYMAMGSSRAASEPLIFAEVEAPLPDVFDTGYAEQKCKAKPQAKKNSVYLSVYRTLEHVPLDRLRSLYLVTRDGRSLVLEPTKMPEIKRKPFYLYQELCPIRPLVVSSQGPGEYCRFMCDHNHKVHVPTIAIADLKVIDFENVDEAGNIGSLYHHNLGHLKDCVSQLSGEKNKKAKTLDRTRVEAFTYQIIDTGIYIGDEKDTVFYPMKTLDELQMHHYAWAKSAMIV